MCITYSDKLLAKPQFKQLFDHLSQGDLFFDLPVSLKCQGN